MGTALTKRHIYSHGLGAGSPFAQPSEFKAEGETPSPRAREGILGQCAPGPPHQRSLIHKEARDRTGRWGQRQQSGKGAGEDGIGLPLTFVTALHRGAEIALSIKEWLQTKELMRLIQLSPLLT